MAQDVLIFNRKLQTLTPYRIETPTPIATEYGTINYVREATSQTELGANQFLEASRQMCKSNVFVPFYTFF